jgi:predicted peptidase
MAHTSKPLGSIPGINHGLYIFTPTIKAQRLVLSYHGFGQRGNGTTDLAKVLNEAMAFEIKSGRVPDTTPAVIISPQYADDANDKVLWTETEKIIRWACKEYNLPLNKVNITGISGGGRCCLEFLYNYKKTNPDGDPNSIVITRAILVAACWLDVSMVNRFGTHTYLWIIHGTGDNTCKYIDSANPNNGAKPFADAYKALGGRVRTSYFPWLDHVPTVWATAYKQQEVKDWICLYS